MGFVAAFLMPLLLGNPVVMMSPFDWLADPLSLFDAIERYHGRFTWLPNFAFHHLANSADGARPRDLSGMKAFINCSEPCRSETFTHFLDRFANWGLRSEQLQVCYAMAETVFAVTQTPPGTPPKPLHVSGSTVRDARAIRFESDDPVAVLSTGRPIDGISIRIEGAEVGEILLQGAFLFEGYFQQDSSVAFTQGWYRTGDIGFMHEGELYVLGRQKDLIIVLGKNFLAHELEALVNRVAGVKPGRAVALGIFNPTVGSEDVIIIAELDETAPQTSVRGGIRSILENMVGLVPRTILLVPQGWLIKSTSGKISRSANIRKFMESQP
jgi:fatty-acyl-CoA synthase